MPKPYTKIFNDDFFGQVVVSRRIVEGVPAIEFEVSAEDYDSNVLWTCITFEDSPEGVAERDNMWNKMNRARVDDELATMLRYLKQQGVLH